MNALFVLTRQYDVRLAVFAISILRMRISGPDCLVRVQSETYGKPILHRARKLTHYQPGILQLGLSTTGRVESKTAMDFLNTVDRRIKVLLGYYHQRLDLF